MTRSFWISRHIGTDGSFRLIEFGGLNAQHFLFPDRSTAEAFLVQRGATEGNARKALDETVAIGRTTVTTTAPD